MNRGVQDHHRSQPKAITLQASLRLVVKVDVREVKGLQLRREIEVDLHVGGQDDGDAGLPKLAVVLVGPVDHEVGVVHPDDLEAGKHSVNSHRWVRTPFMGSHMLGLVF